MRFKTRLYGIAPLTATPLHPRAPHCSTPLSLAHTTLPHREQFDCLLLVTGETALTDVQVLVDSSREVHQSIASLPSREGLVGASKSGRCACECECVCVCVCAYARARVRVRVRVRVCVLGKIQSHLLVPERAIYWLT